VFLINILRLITKIGRLGSTVVVVNILNRLNKVMYDDLLTFYKTLNLIQISTIQIVNIVKG
jgi:hypothetical protein